MKAQIAFPLKGALSYFCQTKAPNQTCHTPTGPRPYFEISDPHVRTQPLQRRSRKQVKIHTSIFKQKPTWISFVTRSKINVTHLSRRNSATSASDSSPSRCLSSLDCWKAAPMGPTSCLIVTLLFNVLFLWYFSLFLSAIYSQSTNL